MGGRVARAGFALGTIMMLSAFAAPQAGLQAVSKLEPGLWQLRTTGQAGGPQSICVADPNMLLQVQHRSSPCSRLVLANEQNGATVHYTCPVNGFGRTSLRVETSRLAKIDTQGIMDNAPFAYRAEARRVGACAGSGSRGSR
jgi:hypothetical protein